MTASGTGQHAPDQRTGRGSGPRARLSRFRRRVRAHPLLDTAWRAGVFTVGWLVVLGGIVLLVFPGPGWVTIFVGFAVLATEFAWARRALRKVRSVAEEVSRRALDPAVRRRNQIIAATAAAIVILGCGLYVWRYGLPFEWPPGVL